MIVNKFITDHIFITSSLRKVHTIAARIKPTPNSPQKIQIERISHVYLRHIDAEKFLSFAEDFGFVEEARDGEAIYLKGYGVDPYCYVVLPGTNSEKQFEGGAFIVKSKEDLEKAMKLPVLRGKSCRTCLAAASLFLFPPQVEGRSTSSGARTVEQLQ